MSHVMYELWFLYVNTCPSGFLLVKHFYTSILLTSNLTAVEYADYSPVQGHLYET